MAATNRNLDEMVKAGVFRKDLLFRLRSISIDLPPLRERPEDINDLVVHFIAQICERCRIGMKGFTPEFIDYLMEYSWPGNVRELKHALESAVAAAGDGPLLFQQHLPASIRIHLARGSLLKKKEKERPPFLAETLGTRRQSAVEEAERCYLQDLMNATKWDIKQACGISGLSKPRLYSLLRKYGVTRGKTLGEVS